MLRHYNGSYVKALTSLFPDLSLEDHRFVSLSSKKKEKDKKTFIPSQLPHTLFRKSLE